MENASDVNESIDRTHECAECGHVQALELREFLGNFMRAECEACGHAEVYMVERWQPGDTSEIRERRRLFYERYERVKAAFMAKHNRYPYSDQEFLDFKRNFVEPVG